MEDSYVSFIGQNRPQSNKKKIIYASLAALGIVGVVACVFAVSFSGSNNGGSVNLSAAKHSAGSLSTDEYEFLFQQFMKQHNKKYSDNEYYERFMTFKKNLDFIKQHNENNYKYKLSVNEFADMSFDEFRGMKLGLAPRSSSKKVVVEDLPRDNLPESIDWREKGAVTAVKNQGQCGSCWAFSTTGSVEGITAIKTGKLLSLSEQQLVDCSGDEGNMGCNGGLMDKGFEYIIENGGLENEKSYPYTASDGSCSASKSENVASISGYKDVNPNDEVALKAAVAQQPVSVAIEADQRGFQFYSGGVFDGPCGTNLDHGVLVVGYGEEDGEKYWLVKNSWGGSWGDNGYIKLARHDDESNPGTCGVAMQASYPTKE